MINLNEATNRIKSAGEKNVRAVPMVGQSALGGNYQIEILENGNWTTLVEGIKKDMADDLIHQAVNRVIID